MTITTLFVRPLDFSVASANESALAPASYANRDEPGLVWRSNNLTSVSVVIDLGSSASYDTVALIGSNLRSSDTIQITTGTSSTGTGSYAGSALAAYSGTKPTGYSTRSVYRIGTRTERYLKLSISAGSHPDGFVEAQRIVVGKAVTNQGLNVSCKQGVSDMSVSNDGPGYQSWDVYPVLTTWKASVSFIAETLWRSDWMPFLAGVGKNRGFLFVPNYEATSGHQTDVIFGRITSEASGELIGSDAWTLELNMTGIAP